MSLWYVVYDFVNGRGSGAQYVEAEDEADARHLVALYARQCYGCSVQEDGMHRHEERGIVVIARPAPPWAVARASDPLFTANRYIVR